MHRRGFGVWGVALACVITASAGQARAQAERAEEGAEVGYELMLHGRMVAERGGALHLSGIGYEVHGLSELRGSAGLVLEARITTRDSRGNYGTASETQVTTGADGRFEVTLDVPTRALTAPRVELRLARRNRPGRVFRYPLSVASLLRGDLLTDRRRYQPAETVRVLLRVVDRRSEQPRADVRVELELLDPSATAIASHRGQTGGSGALVAELAIPEGAPTGAYRLRARVAEGPVLERPLEVWRRTVERLMAEVVLDAADEDGVSQIVPGAALRGRVLARTPSGTPVAGANVELRTRPDANPTQLVTDASGEASFDIRAPAFLSGEVSREQLSARVVHPAHGAAVASAAYILTRARALVSVQAENGAAVPEVASRLWVSVTDARGRPLRSAPEVIARGPAIPRGEARARPDGGGLLEIPIEVPRAAASRMREGPCAGQTATTVVFEVALDPPVTSRVCVPVNVDALVRPRVVGAPLLEAGASVEIALERRSGARGRPILLEALHEGRALAAAWVEPTRDRGRLTLPAGWVGLFTIRARPIAPASARESNDVAGAVGIGAGASDVVLVRPANPFELHVEPAQERFQVRERAEIGLRAEGWSGGPAYAALLVRDEAAHGGEGPWDLYFMRGQLHRAARDGAADEEAARLLRYALSANAPVDGAPRSARPLDPPPWHSTPSETGGDGMLRDPVGMREELLRRGIAQTQMQLEAIVRGLGADAAARAPIVEVVGGRTRFHPDVLEHLRASRRLGVDAALGLGGRPMTVRELEAADPGFSFDTVAGRVARGRLALLLGALARLTDPDDVNAQRLSAGLPPERWLSTLVQHGLVSADALVDPWGRPFALRRVTGRRPRVVLSERALDWELASPGPDGQLGTADDVNDPFARAVPEGSPYAVHSGEERFLRQVAVLAPATTVLSRMVQAYRRVALAAAEERRQSAVSAAASELDDDAIPDRDGDGIPDAYDEEDEEAGLEGLGLRGTGRGGGGLGGRADARRSRAPGVAAESMAMAEPAPMEQGMQQAQQAPGRPPADHGAVLAAMVREDFPATLFFAGELQLEDGSASVTVPLADALTRYHVEAIAWSASGWATSASARISVDQEALVDAPVPPDATVGDRLRLPVRLENRGAEALEARLTLRAEGLSIESPEVVALTLAPGEARESEVELTLGAAGEGTLVIEAARADGTALDAVRRPLIVRPDHRTVRDRRGLLIEGADEIRIDIPEGASPRAPGQLRLSVGVGLFGDIAASGDPYWAGFAFALGGEMPEEIRRTLLEAISRGEANEPLRLAPQQAALALGALYGESRLGDEDARRALAAATRDLPDPADEREAGTPQHAHRLLALAPMARSLDRRPALSEDAERALGRLRRLVSGFGARLTEQPETQALAAAALALTRRGERDPRAVELVRRAERFEVRLGDRSWLEADEPSAAPPHIRATALLALARIGLGRRSAALLPLRGLTQMLRDGVPGPAPWEDAPIARRAPIRPPPWSAPDAALAASAAALLTGPAPRGVRVTLDGAPLEIERRGAAWTASLPAALPAGTHTLRVDVAAPPPPPGTGPGAAASPPPPGTPGRGPGAAASPPPPGRGPGGGENVAVAIALADVQISYGLPWDRPPARRAGLGLAIEGEVGPRDARSGLVLVVHQRAPRVVTRPTVEIELPAGAELDEPSRERLAALLREPARQEGRTVVLPLRAMPPGARVRLPLPARWSVGGSLRGLGAVAYDAAAPLGGEALAVSLLPSRAVEIADRGEEPEPPEPETLTPPAPPPLPIVRRLGAEGHR